MRKIQRKYLAKKLIGGIFILLWNLMPVSANNALMTFSRDIGDGAEAAQPDDSAALDNLQKRGILEIDTTFRRKLVNRTERFLFVTLPGDDFRITVTVRPCYGEISWSLYFRKTEEMANADGLRGYGTQLYLYQSGDEMRSHYVNNTDLRTGWYIIDITAVKESATAFEILVSNWPREPALFKIADKVSDPRETMVKFDFENRSLSVKIWKDYSEEEFPDVRFKLLLHPRKNYDSMCAAEMEDNESDRNDLLGEHTNARVGDANSLIFKVDNMVQGRQYYAHVYAVGSAGFAVPYASTSFVYKPTKPIGLKDGRLVHVNLKDSGGRISFKHKVNTIRLRNLGDVQEVESWFDDVMGAFSATEYQIRLNCAPLLVGNKTTMQRESTNILRIFVIPCGGIVLVEIKHKHAVIEHRKIREFAIFSIENVTNRQRYVIKIIDLSLNELRKYNNVSVLATIRPRNEPLPPLPTDYTLHVRYNETDKCNAAVSVISWNPIISNETIEYCVSVQERKKDEFDYDFSEDAPDAKVEDDPFVKSIDQQRLVNQCAVDWSALYSSKTTKCFRRVANNSRRRIVKKLKNLKPDCDYLIQVIARKNKREGAVTYKLLRISRKDCNFHRFH